MSSTLGGLGIMVDTISIAVDIYILTTVKKIMTS